MSHDKYKMLDLCTQSFLNLLSSLGLLGLEPSPWCSTPETEMSTVTIHSVLKEMREATGKPRSMQPCNRYALLKSLSDRWPAFSRERAASASWKFTCELEKEQPRLPTNKLLGSTDVERGSPEFLKRIFNHLLTFMSRKHHFCTDSSN